MSQVIEKKTCDEMMQQQIYSCVPNMSHSCNRLNF